MEIDVRKPEGNVFFIMAKVKDLLEQVGRGDEWPSIEAKMKSGDYRNALNVAEEATFGSITFTGLED